MYLKQQEFLKSVDLAETHYNLQTNFGLLYHHYIRITYYVKLKLLK